MAADGDHADPDPGVLTHPTPWGYAYWHSGAELKDASDEVICTIYGKDAVLVARRVVAAMNAHE